MEIPVIHKRKALVVGIVPSEQTAARQLLAYFNLDVVLAGCGDEAVSLYEKDPSYDLIVVDIEMQGVNGLTTAKLIRQCQIAKKPWIVGLTDNFATYENKRSLGALIDIFVPKPLSMGVVTQVTGLSNLHHIHSAKG